MNWRSETNLLTFKFVSLLKRWIWYIKSLVLYGIYFSLDSLVCYPAGIRRVLHLTRFLSVSASSASFFWQHSSDLYISSRCWDRFNQTCVTRTRRGHRGQKGHFTKNVTPTDYKVWSHDSCICISLTPSYKNYGSKNSLGVIWGYRGQKVIFIKNATFYRLDGMVIGYVSYAYESAKYPVSKLWF